MKYSDKDLKRLRSVQQRVARINRLSSKAGISINLPSRGKGSFTSKKDFNAYIKKAEKILSQPEYRLHTGKYGFVYSDADKKALSDALKERNKFRREEYKKIRNLPIMTGGKEQPTTIGFMKEAAKYNILKSFDPRHRDISKIKSRKDFEKYMTILEKETSPDYYNQKHKNFKKNYLKALKTVYGEKPKYAQVEQAIKNTSPEQFAKYYYSDEYITPDFIYDPYSDADWRWSRIENEWLNRALHG